MVRKSPECRDRVLRSTGLLENIEAAAFFSAERAMREGAWGRAEALFREAIEVSTTCGVPDIVAMARLACLTAYRGDGASTTSLLAECQEELRRASPWHAHWLDVAEGALALSTGRPEHAVMVLSPLLEVPYQGRGARDAPGRSAGGSGGALQLRKPALYA